MTQSSHSSSSPGQSGFAADGRPPPNQFRVLIVDDQAANLLILSRLLNIAGYLTFEARDGREALNRIATQSIDLAIMDVEMPNMSGLEAVLQIRKFSDPRLASLPILATSGNPQPETQQKLLDAGANAFLTKPFDTQLLLKVIADLLSPTPDPSPSTGQSGERASKSGSVKNLSQS